MKIEIKKSSIPGNFSVAFGLNGPIVMDANNSPLVEGVHFRVIGKRTIFPKKGRKPPRSKLVLVEELSNGSK